MSLPGASELFRPTQPAATDPAATDAAAAGGEAAPASPSRVEPDGVVLEAATSSPPAGTEVADGSEASSNEVQPTLPTRSPRRTPVASGSRPGASGRVRHDEKITVYVSADELLALEEARLALRRQGIAVDRGRIVRAAIALAMADLHEHGGEGELVTHLLGS